MDVPIDELAANLAEYKEQLAQVEALLLEYPDNEEYQELYSNLKEVITLTEDVQRTAGNAEAQDAPPETTATPPTQADAGAAGLITAAPTLQLPSVLPPQVAQQIRAAQQKAAILGQAPAAWAIGGECQALYSDGQWYEAVVKAVTTAGQFVVAYEGYEEQQEVSIAEIRMRPETDGGYTGVSAPTRKRVADGPVVLEEMPAWLEIKETDDEKTKARKRKLQKSYKSKQRFQKMDKASQDKQKSWQDFLSGGKKKKKMPLVKKDSIFRASDTGKVGVTGSGRGVTTFKQPGRHDFQPTAAGNDDE